MGFFRDYLSYRRTLIALALTLVAVAVPSLAWYFSGHREIERQENLEEKNIYHRAYKRGVDLADRLASRLEEVRVAESGRSFYHYQNLYHDPRGAAEGISVSVSPLAEGSTDPFIAAHFQVDANGRLTLPTLNDEFPELGLQDQAEQCTLLSELSDVAMFCSLEPVEGLAAEPAVEDSLRALAWGEPWGEVGGRVEVLSRAAWNQHLRANELYADLKSGRQRRIEDGDGESGVVKIPVDPFHWHTLPVGDKPSMVALRRVETPAGPWTQGFVVSSLAVGQMLETSPFRATFGPAAAELEGEEPLRPDRADSERVSLEVAGTSWELSLDVSAALAESFGRAELEREAFLQSFGLGTFAAGIAGLLLVFMVYQSEKLARERAQFAAAAAHELRTPLAGLQLYGEMLAEGMGDPQSSRRYARRLAGEAERLGRVVTNVLSFTRLERDSLGVKPQPDNLCSAVRDACERQRTTLEENGATLVLDLPDDLPSTLFDRDAIAHVVQNLLDNAEKYTRDAEDRSIRVRVAQGEGHSTLTVSDNGPGIPESLERRLFRPFSRGQHPDATEGLGLGLVLVRALVEAQGGRVRYRAARSGGAAFVVQLPSA